MQFCASREQNKWKIRIFNGYALISQKSRKGEGRIQIHEKGSSN